MIYLHLNNESAIALAILLKYTLPCSLDLYFMHKLTFSSRSLFQSVKYCVAPGPHLRTIFVVLFVVVRFLYSTTVDSGADNICTTKPQRSSNTNESMFSISDRLYLDGSGSFLSALRLKHKSFSNPPRGLDEILVKGPRSDTRTWTAVWYVDEMCVVFVY